MIEAKNLEESEEKMLELQGKFSDSLNYLLCGNQFGALDFVVAEEEGLIKINALFGRHEIKGDRSFDGAFYISPSEVKTIAIALSKISENELERRAQLFKSFCDYSDEYYTFLTDELLPFYKQASEENSGILIDISA